MKTKKSPIKIKTPKSSFGTVKDIPNDAAATISLNYRPARPEGPPEAAEQPTRQQQELPFPDVEILPEGVVNLQKH